MWVIGAGEKAMNRGFGEFAHVAQPVEHFLGKEEVTGSIPVVGFAILPRDLDREGRTEAIR